jgi:hydroxymethylbilane synthase
MKQTTIKIGTRGSQLALYQAEITKSALERNFPELIFEIVVIQTKGDKILDVALSKIGDKGLFTKEIENALVDKSVDIAVHSLKDLPTTLPDGLILGAVLERGEFRDALVSRSGRRLYELNENDVIATSSLRRRASLMRYNQKFNIIDIRGNVNTRLKKMEEGYCDAMIMAAAGLQRLELDSYITEIINPEVIIPAASQGIIAIESRAGDKRTSELLAAINHMTTWNAGMAERSFLRTVEGGCQVPAGCFSYLNGDTFFLTGFVASVDGTVYLLETENGLASEPQAIGEKLAQRLLARGAGEIMAEIRK